MMRKDTREQKIIYSAFLVSLAIVIVSIITVMTYSLYKTSKNSNVLEEKSKEITKIADALEQYKKDNWFYPSPEKSIWILAWKWNFILYQGYASKDLTEDRLKLKDIKYSDYIYTITKTGDKYELMSFCKDWKILWKWNRLWIFVDKNNIPFQDLEDAPNNIANTDEIFYVYFDDSVKIVWNDRKLTPIMYISEYEYDPDLVAYWNMETLTEKGYLYDISGNKFHWIPDGWIEIWKEDWVVWKATKFSWEMQRVVVNEFAKSLKENTDYSFAFYFKDVFDNPKEFNTAVWITSDQMALKLRLSTNNIKNVEDYDDWRWHLFVANIDWAENKAEYFIDGKKIEMKFPSWSLFFSETFYMSIWYWIINDYFKWLLDEIRVYKKRLSQDEIDELYNKIKK